MPQPIPIPPDNDATVPGPLSGEQAQIETDLGTFWDVYIGTEKYESPKPLFQSEVLGRPLTKQPRDGAQNDWAIGILLGTFILMAFIRRLYPRRSTAMIRAFTSNRFVRQLLREEQVFSHRSTLSFLLVFLLSLSLFLTLAANQMQWLGSVSWGIGFFGKVMLLLVGYQLFKAIVTSLSAGLLRIESAIQEYQFNQVLFNIAAGLILIPVSVGILFLGGKNPMAGPKLMLVWGGFIGIAILFAARLVKTFYLGIAGTNFSRVYLIMYLCTLEILPLMVILKYLGLFPGVLNT